MAADGTDGMEGACFDFDDMKALRDEYEERVRKAERERDAAIDVLKRDAEQRIAAMQRDHETRLEHEATARQELIEDLTVELAGAREDGERRARSADEARAKTEALLRRTLADVTRIEGELTRMRETLAAALNAPTPVASAPVPPPASIVPAMSLVSRTPPPVPSDAATAAAWGAKKRKIRLR
jgi:hypothetical protein